MPVLAHGPPRTDEPRFGLIHAMGVAILLHLLLLVLATVAPELFLAPEMLLAAEPENPPPIKFTFIDVPDDNVVEANPDADLVSDKAREESGPTPRETTPEGQEPPSTGNTRERIAGGVAAVAQPPAQPPSEQLPRTAPPTPEQQEAPPEPEQQEPQQEPPPEPRQETEQAREEASSPDQDTTETARRDEPVDPGPGPGAAPDREVMERNRRRTEPRKKDISGALNKLATPPLLTDLQAVAPPSDSPSDPSQGRATVWSFDNPNPAYPVNIGTLSFDSKGADFGPWLREFHARVLNEWHRNLEEWHQRVWREVLGSQSNSDAERYNTYARRMNSIAGVTGVDFNVTREGSVVALVVVHASGSIDLDRSVQKTLRNVILPALPEDYPDEILEIRAGFYYNTEPAR
jgi:outer membrane biosynthesis protein TonB